MQISDHQINTFIDLYRKNFGVVLDRQSAYEKGITLLNLVSIVYHPITSEDLKTFQAKQTEFLRKQK